MSYAAVMHRLTETTAPRKWGELLKRWHVAIDETGRGAWQARTKRSGVVMQHRSLELLRRKVLEYEEAHGVHP
ncbi:hypothetical protein GCM10018965_084260 [Nonomuraea roseola]